MGRFSQPPGPMYFRTMSEKRSRPRVRRRVHWNLRARRGVRNIEGEEGREGAMNVSAYQVC
jgi:hypothetical protein